MLRGFFAVFVAAAALACAASPHVVPSAGAAEAAQVTARPRALTPADVAARALPAVVTVRTAQSLGTGFVVRADGWIATNLHVVVGGPRVRVVLHDARELEVVEVLAASTKHDLVLLRVEAHGLPTLTLGDSDAMRPGDPVVAIGNPMGLEATVSNGLVSARRRVDGGIEVLQVSAPIAPGSSGGPLFNERGEVIGIATAVLEGGQNLAFGVPTRYLLPLIAQPTPIPYAEFATLLAKLVHLQEAGMPRVRRSVPHHTIALLDGCPQDAQRLTVKMLGEAIEAGAPLYNAHNPAACYHVYDGATSDLLRRLPAACKAPAKALADAQRRAAQLGDPVAQAWALRDAFDGMLDVIARKQEQ